MTDRHSGYVITLDRDIREDDAERVVTALRQIRGVVDVQPIGAADPGAEYVTRTRVQIELADKLLELHAEVLRR